MWYHNTGSTSNTKKYRMEQTVSDEAPFIVESTLTIMNLGNQDNGNVTCVAMVTPDEGQPYVTEMTTQLSVLGE